MQRFWAYSRILATGAPAPNATIEVFAAATLTPSTIFADNLDPPTPLANPYSADADGYFYFLAANGRYDVRLSNGGIVTPYTWPDILLSDFGVVGTGVTEISLGGSRETGPLPVASPETFSLIDYPAEGVLLPAEAKLAVGTTVNVVVECQAALGSSVVATIVDAADNVLATDAAPFTDDTQMVAHTFVLPLQPADLQVFLKLTVTDGTDQPGLLAIAKLVFIPA